MAMAKVRIYKQKTKKAIITAAQDQTLRTNWIKANIDGVDCFFLCGVCQSVDESSMHIASRWTKLASDAITLDTV